MSQQSERSPVTAGFLGENDRGHGICGKDTCSSVDWPVSHVPVRSLPVCTPSVWTHAADRKVA